MCSLSCASLLVAVIVQGLQCHGWQGRRPAAPGKCGRVCHACAALALSLLLRQHDCCPRRPHHRFGSSFCLSAPARPCTPRWTGRQTQYFVPATHRRMPRRSARRTAGAPSCCPRQMATLGTTPCWASPVSRACFARVVQTVSPVRPRSDGGSMQQCRGCWAAAGRRGGPTRVSTGRQEGESLERELARPS